MEDLKAQLISEANLDGFLNWMTEVWDGFSFLTKVWLWVTSPSVAPWIGALAAIGAAFLNNLTAWLKSPKYGAFSVLRVGFFWLVIVVLVSFAMPRGNGTDENGDGKKPELPITKTKPVVPIDDNGKKPNNDNDNNPMSDGPPEGIDLIVLFPLVPGNGGILEFSCDLLPRVKSGGTSKLEIRGKDTQDFEKQLTDQLNKIKLKTQPNISIQANPWPGQPAIRKIEGKVLEIFPGSSVSIQLENKK